jgi:hypothetical protein
MTLSRIQLRNKKEKKKNEKLTRQLCIVVQAILERFETVNARHSDTARKQAHRAHDKNKSEWMVLGRMLSINERVCLQWDEGGTDSSGTGTWSARASGTWCARSGVKCTKFAFLL